MKNLDKILTNWLKTPLYNLKIFDREKRSCKICEYLAVSYSFRQLVINHDFKPISKNLIISVKVKGALSQCERAPFTLRYATYCTTICHVWHRERAPFAKSFFMLVHKVYTYWLTNKQFFAICLVPSKKSFSRIQVSDDKNFRHLKYEKFWQNKILNYQFWIKFLKYLSNKSWTFNYYLFNF